MTMVSRHGDTQNSRKSGMMPHISSKGNVNTAISEMLMERLVVEADLGRGP